MTVSPSSGPSGTKAAHAERPSRVLVLGGTSEAVGLATRLAAIGDVAVVSSLAGRTSRPRTTAGDVRTGGFGGAEGLARWLGSEHIDAVVDATHPFAAQMPLHAAHACRARGIPRLRLCRNGWQAGPGDRWTVVPDMDAAADALEARGAHRAFLALGRQQLAAFARLADMWFLVRSIEHPDPLPLAAAEVVLDRGPFDRNAERALMASRRVDVLVTRDSGGPATAPKLEAARELALPVVVVSRPPLPAGPLVTTVDEALAWCTTTLGTGAPR